MIRRKHRSVPTLNTTSTADISFMLLIFFLVTSSMDIDKGLARVLPPLDKQEQPLETMVERKDLLAIDLLADGTYAIDGQPVEVRQLRPRMADFVASHGAGHLVMLKVDSTATYEAYFSVQNALGLAYRDARMRLSRQTYGMPYDQLNASQREAIRQQCPQRVAEEVTALPVSNPQTGLPQPDSPLQTQKP